MKCAYCEDEIKGEYSQVTEEPLSPIGRFINGELRLLKKGDCICYDCLVVRKPLEVK